MRGFGNSSPPPHHQNPTDLCVRGTVAVISIIIMQDESMSPPSSLPICLGLGMSGMSSRILPPECSCLILAFLTVRDIVNMAATSQQSLAASLPILRRIHGSFFFGNDDDDDHEFGTAPGAELRDCCSFVVGHEEDPREQGEWDGPGQQEEQDQQPQPRGELESLHSSSMQLHHPTATSFRKEARRPSFTLHERIQMLADLIPSKYSNRANIQALRAALSAAADARQRRSDSSGSASSCGARIQELQSLMRPLRLWYEITRAPTAAVATTTSSNHHHRADGAAATTTCSNSCSLDEYLGDVYCVLYLSLPSSSSSSPSQQRQQLHRIIIGKNSRRPTPAFSTRVPTNNNNHHNSNGGIRDNDHGSGAGGGVRNYDWVYWHARWLTTPGLLTNEQRTRFGVMMLPEQHCPQQHLPHQENSSVAPRWFLSPPVPLLLPNPSLPSLPPTTTLAAASSSLSSSFLTLVYDDFAPLGPQFRGRDIVRMLDVSASAFSRHHLDHSSVTSSAATLAVVREWIVTAHEQAILHRPLTVRPPEVRFGG
jgi:hypothetical protein